MTAQPSPAAEPDACPLCTTAVVPDDERCPECGCALGGVAGRSLYPRAALLWTIAGFLAVYLVTIAIVAVTR